MKRYLSKRIACLACLMGLFALSQAPVAFATTKGLSQIVTPDIQKLGEFSLSYQRQAEIIGNPDQLQGELGLTSRLEVAIFEGFRPRETIFGAEYAILDQEPWLLSVGFLNLSTRGGSPQPFVETGHYTASDKWIVGALYAANQIDSKADLLLGYAHDFDTHWRAQIDFQSNDQNFSTLGITCTLNEHFQVNPAVYFANRKLDDLSGYIVVTYTIPVWNSAKSKEPGAAPAL